MRGRPSFIRQWAGDELIVPAIAPHSMYTLDCATLKEIRAVATRERAPVIIHLAETRDEVKVAREKYKSTPTGFLESIGFWGERTIAAHGVHVTPADIRILATRRVGVSHNPESNMKLASGTSPVPALQKAGVVVGLGTDGAASNNDLDMFEAMRQAAFLHKLTSNDPSALPARTALRMATIDGARVLGIDREIGSLEPGKRADLLIVSMRTARQTPMYDPLSHLVYVTRGDDVQTVVVNGKIVMRNRKVLTLDESAVIDEANALGCKGQAGGSEVVQSSRFRVQGSRGSVEILLTTEQIQTRIAEMGAQIERDYPAGEGIHLVGVLKGGFMFMADLVRAMSPRVTLDFIAVSSYGKSTKSSGEVRMVKDVDAGLEGRHVIIVEDIVDTGLTLTYLQDILRARAPEVAQDRVPAEQAVAAQSRCHGRLRGLHH